MTVVEFAAPLSALGALVIVFHVLLWRPWFGPWSRHLNWRRHRLEHYRKTGEWLPFSEPGSDWP